MISFTLTPPLVGSCQRVLFFFTNIVHLSFIHILLGGWRVEQP